MGNHAGTVIFQPPAHTSQQYKYGTIGKCKAGHILHGKDGTGNGHQNNSQPEPSGYGFPKNKKGNDCAFFLGHGTLLSTPNVVIKAETPAEILLEFKKGAWYYPASADCSISIKKKTYKLKANTAEMELK